MIAMTILFCASLIGIAALFLVKQLEEKRERVFAPSLHLAADKAAEVCKRFLMRSEAQLALMPPLIARIVRRLLATSAVSFGGIAQQVAEQSHRLADLVSHKHNFERRETRSEFLKQVSEHTIRNQNGSNPGTTQAATGHSGAGKNGNHISSGGETGGQL